MIGHWGSSKQDELKEQRRALRAERLAVKIGEWRRRPDQFVREVIDAEPDDWQAVALCQLANPPEGNNTAYVSIAACHGPGKDALAAWAILWALTCFPDVRIPCTAPTGHQLYDLLWAEGAKWHGRMLSQLRNCIVRKKDRIENIKHPTARFAVARTAKAENPEALQGFHAPVVLLIVDEASGVHDIIFETLEGSTTDPRVMFLMIGNPTQSKGYFAESHDDDDRWFRMRIMSAHALEPDEALDEGVWASSRMPASYCENIAKKYGKDSNIYRVRVLGLFPRSDNDTVIPFEWVEAASMRDLHGRQTNAISIGVDVARFGSDDSSVIVRQGRNILTGGRRHGHDITQTTGWVVTTARRFAKLLIGEEKIYIFVDEIGVGAGVVDLLRQIQRERDHPWVIVAVNVADRSTRKDPECFRKRDELWWRSREFFRVGMPAIAPVKKQPTDLIGFDSEEDRDQLINELSSPRYTETLAGQIKVESKDDMKKRKVASPNMADAFVNTLAFEAYKPEEKKKDSWKDGVMAESAEDWMVE